ncbi:MAG TPA: response regulator, partial [Geoalkalibacter subterraneus]|nr:response regulator [Geoalkalibacter subterraneus]
MNQGEMGMDLADRNEAAPTILVVDDAPFFRRSVRNDLEKHGFRVLDSNHGGEARTLLAQENVCVVLTDLDMPQMNGLNVLRMVREQYPELPVIIISSHQDFSAARQVLRHGALDYLVKPLEEDELIESVRRAVDVHRASLDEA